MDQPSLIRDDLSSGSDAASPSQLAGNLFSALLVPLCVKAMATDWSFAIPLMDRVQKADIRGDTMVLLGLVGLTTLFFTTFDGEVKDFAPTHESPRLR